MNNLLLIGIVLVALYYFFTKKEHLQIGHSQPKINFGRKAVAAAAASRDPKPFPDPQDFMLYAQLIMDQNPREREGINKWMESMVRPDPRPGVFTISKKDVELVQQRMVRYQQMIESAGFKIRRLF